MGSYIDSNLVRGERVLYEAHYHWSVWIAPVVVIIFGLLACMPDGDDHALGIFLTTIGFMYLIATCLKVATDEFAVTTQRLIIKTGVIRRTTLELNLRKVETVSVSQGLLDRIFGGGTLECRGTGSTLSKISNIEEPYEFRKAFQDALDRYSYNAVEEKMPSAQPIKDSSLERNIPQTMPSTSATSTDKTTRLYQLKELLDSGILTQEEFNTEKKKILNS